MKKLIYFIVCAFCVHTAVAQETLRRLFDETISNTTSENYKVTQPANSKQVVTWVGAGNNGLWTTAANWSTGSVPTATDDVVINAITPLDINRVPKIGNGYQVTESVTIKSLELRSGSLLQVDVGSNITITGDVSVADNAYIGFGSVFYGRRVTRRTISSTIIVGGTTTIGNTNSGFIFTTQTYGGKSTNNWSLVSSPMVGEDIGGFVNMNNLRKRGNYYGIATFNTRNRVWDYYTGATGAGTGNNPLTNAGNFVKGRGYMVSPRETTTFMIHFISSGSTYVIPLPTGKHTVLSKGNITNTDVVIPLVGKRDSGGSGFNLVGNPYSAHIPVGNATNAVNNILRANAGVLSEQTLWFFDTINGAFVPINHANNRLIAPGQGFFVRAITNGGNFNFTTAMRTHSSRGVFQKEVAKPSINLEVSNSKSKATTSVYYIANTTEGFDNGYDSSLFDGVQTNFNVFTNLVDASTNKKMAIQSLPNNNYENMIIPVGIIANEKTKDVSFTVNTSNFPAGVKVYLEDRERGVFTDVSKGSYSTTLNKATNGTTGRFYLHTSSLKALGTENVATLNSVGIFNNNNLLTVNGLNTKGNLELFNVLGKKVFTNKLEAKITNKMELPSLAKGVYIVQLATLKGKVSKKIIIE